MTSFEICKKNLKSLRVCTVAVFLGVLLSADGSRLAQAHSVSGPSASSLRDAFQLKAIWSSLGKSQDLKTWSLAELEKLKKVVTKEKDPNTGKVTRFEGFLVSSLLDKALEGLTVENRALVDLVVFKGKNGVRATIPRALISKYPLVLAYHWDKEGMADSREPLFSVIPWSTHPKILNEDLPLETYFIPHVAQIELTNYRERYQPLFLKRRTDPSAMRGEKLFVQNCTGCHSGNRPPNLSAKVEGTAKKPHAGRISPMSGMAEKMSDRDWKSIVQYLQAYQVENPVQAKGFFSTYTQASQ